MFGTPLGFVLIPRVDVQHRGVGVCNSNSNNDYFCSKTLFENHSKTLKALEITFPQLWENVETRALIYLKEFLSC